MVKEILSGVVKLRGIRDDQRFGQDCSITRQAHGDIDTSIQAVHRMRSMYIGTRSSLPSDIVLVLYSDALGLLMD